MQSDRKATLCSRTVRSLCTLSHNSVKNCHTELHNNVTDIPTEEHEVTQRRKKVWPDRQILSASLREVRLTAKPQINSIVQKHRLSESLSLCLPGVRCRNFSKFSTTHILVTSIDWCTRNSKPHKSKSKLLDIRFISHPQTGQSDAPAGLVRLFPAVCYEPSHFLSSDLRTFGTPCYSTVQRPNSQKCNTLQSRPSTN